MSVFFVVLFDPFLSANKLLFIFADRIDRIVEPLQLSSADTCASLLRDTSP